MCAHTFISICVHIHIHIYMCIRFWFESKFIISGALFRTDFIVVRKKLYFK